MAVNGPFASSGEIKLGSNRTFGLVLSIFFVVVALMPVVRGAPIRWWALIVAAPFLVIGLIAPRLLSPLNRAWFALGQMLHHVVSPVILAVIFYGTVLPTGLVLRALGKDLLRLKFDRKAATYWIPREPPGPAPGSMNKQY